MKVITSIKGVMPGPPLDLNPVIPLGDCIRKAGGGMKDINCQCGKILCQSHGNMLIIKCRHCKRFIILKINDPQQTLKVTCMNMLDKRWVR